MEDLAMTIQNGNLRNEERLDLNARGADDSPVKNESVNPNEAELRKAYLQQLRRMSCPGCGEGEPVF
jgi:hypothetical protein